MKVAIVHDYLKEIGGAERVLMTLKEIWPDAPVYTAYTFPEYWGQFKDVLSSWDIHLSWGWWLPFKSKFLSYYTLLSPWFFKAMDLSDYDLVIISQTGGYFPNGVKVGPQTKVVTYCHTPPRFLYGFPTATQERYKWYWKVQSHLANHVLRMVDFMFAQKPTKFIANSHNVARRIQKFYRREAIVVYPPIEIPHPKSLSSAKEREISRGDYYVIVSRIVGSKNIELAVEAAKKYGFRLIVAGRAIGKSGAKIVQNIKGDLVTYEGEVSEARKQELLAHAQGFLALESEADFGISTVEPMAYGTPVVAYKAGGYLETVTDGENGYFFDQLTPESLWEAVQKLEKKRWDRKMIQKSAERFSVAAFKRGIQAAVLE